MNELSTKITEIVARAILYKNKQADGDDNQSTDEWLSVYRGEKITTKCTLETARRHYERNLKYNKFRFEVDNIVGALMSEIQKSEVLK